MKILIDIGHPAHVHYFKNFAIEMLKKGNDVLFTCRDKEFEIDLLKHYNFKFISLGAHFKTISGKVIGLIKFNIKLFRIAYSYKPDIFLSAGSMYAAQVSWLLSKPHITIEDSGNMEQIRLYKPFTKYILTPNALPMKFGKKHIRYEGFHQNAYLHPKYFSLNNEFRKELNINAEEKIFLLRLVALNASHDFTIKKIDEQKFVDLVKFLDGIGTVYISSEQPLIDELKKFKLDILPHEIHKFMSICDLIVGESGTMTNEAAYLGIPNVLIANVDLDVHKKHVDLGLKIHHKFLNDDVLNEIIKITKNLDEIKSQFSENSKKYRSNSINLTEFLINVVELEINKNK